MPAPGTVIQMAAQSRRAAALNGTQYFQLLIAEPGSVSATKRSPCVRSKSATSTVGRVIRVYVTFASAASVLVRRQESVPTD